MGSGLQCGAKRSTQPPSNIKFKDLYVSMNRSQSDEDDPRTSYEVISDELDQSRVCSVSMMLLLIRDIEILYSMLNCYRSAA